MDEVIGYQLKDECIKSKTLTKEENLELVRKIQAGNSSAANKFVLGNGKLVIRVIKDKFNYYMDNDDIFQAGVLGLLKAAKLYDFNNNASISTYAYDWIRQSIQRHVDNTESTIRIPVHASEKLVKIRQAINKYENENLSSDRNEFIQEETGFSLKMINALIPYVDGVTSLNLIKDTDSEYGDEIIDLLSDKSDSIELMIEKKQVNEKLHEILKEALNDKEYTIIMHKFGFLGKQKTFDEIKYLVGINSRQGIQQCEARALNKLRKPKYVAVLKELYYN